MMEVEIAYRALRGAPLWGSCQNAVGDSATDDDRAGTRNQPRPVFRRPRRLCDSTADRVAFDERGDDAGALGVLILTLSLSVGHHEG